MVLGYVLIVVSMLGLYAVHRGGLAMLFGAPPAMPGDRSVAGVSGGDAHRSEDLR